MSLLETSSGADLIRVVAEPTPTHIQNNNEGFRAVQLSGEKVGITSCTCGGRFCGYLIGGRDGTDAYMSVTGDSESNRDDSVLLNRFPLSYDVALNLLKSNAEVSDHSGMATVFLFA
jgi:hypothetical protein